MNKTDRKALFIVTITLDLILLILWSKFSKEFTNYDKIFIYFVLISHFFFYISLYYEHRPTLDILHISVAISCIMGVIVKHKYLLSFILVFLICLQIQWLSINKCILNTEEQNHKSNFGYGKITSILTLLYTCYISLKIGKVNSKKIIEKEIK